MFLACFGSFFFVLWHGCCGSWLFQVLASGLAGLLQVVSGEVLPFLHCCPAVLYGFASAAMLFWFSCVLLLCLWPRLLLLGFYCFVALLFFFWPAGAVLFFLAFMLFSGCVCQ